MLTDQIFTTQDDNEYETHKVLEQDKGEKVLLIMRDREENTMQGGKRTRTGVDIYTHYFTLEKR